MLGTLGARDKPGQGVLEPEFAAKRSYALPFNFPRAAPRERGEGDNGGQWKVRPPSTASAAPVIKDDSVPVRNRMACAISRGSAMRFSAYRSTSRSRPAV